ncbi:MAG: hypothetical protein WD898_00885 [Candidatus Paceibacterota bacterium]
MELDIVFLLVLFWLLGQAALSVVDSLVVISARLRLSSFIVGFFVLGMATSMPELLVGVNSVIENVPSLSLGHLMGASIVLLSLMTGIYAFLNKEVKTARSFKPSELVIINILILLPFVFAVDGKLSQVDGLIIMATFFGYLWFKFRQKNNNEEYRVEDGITTKSAVGSLIIGILLIVLFSRFIVNIAGDIIAGLGWSPLLFGILILSIGTNLPELAITYTTRRRPRKYFAFGNILGSAAANSLVAGIVVFFQPITILDPKAFFVGGVFLVASVLMFDFSALSNRELTRKEGILMLVIYAVFLVTMINLGTI